MSKNRRTAVAKVTTELNIHPEDRFSKKGPTTATQIQHPQ